MPKKYCWNKWLAVLLGVQQLHILMCGISALPVVPQDSKVEVQGAQYYETPFPMIQSAMLNGGYLRLADFLPPGASQLPWEHTIHLRSEFGIDLTIDGTLGPDVSPHDDAMEWQGSRNRILVSCEDMQGAAAILAESVTSPGNTAIASLTFLSIHWHNCPQVLRFVDANMRQKVAIYFIDCVFGVVGVPGAPATDTSQSDPAAPNMAHAITVLVADSGSTSDDAEAVQIELKVQLTACWMFSRLAQEQLVALWGGNLGMLGAVRVHTAGAHAVEIQTVYCVFQGFMSTMASTPVDGGPSPLLGFLTVDASANANPSKVVSVVHSSLSDLATVIDVDYYADVADADHLSCGSLAVLGTQSLLVYNTTFTNSSALACKTLYFKGSDVNVISSVFDSNSCGMQPVVGIDAERVTFERCSVQHNVGRGAVQVVGPSITACDMCHFAFMECTFWNNTAVLGDHGALSPYARIDRSSHESDPQYRGGAISSRVPLIVIDSVFQDNVASANGGAISVHEDAAVGGWGYTNITGCRFERNRALGFESTEGTLLGLDTMGCGGALFGPLFIVVNSAFLHNSASDEGGAIWARNITFKPFSETPAGDAPELVFVGNSAASGGAVFGAEGGWVRCDDCSSEHGSPFCVNWLDWPGALFQANSARLYGGALYIGRSSNFLLLRMNMTGNTALLGGAVALMGGTKHAVYKHVYLSTFSGNRAGQSGGALYSLASSFTVSVSSFAGNVAGQEGGAIALTESTMSLGFDYGSHSFAVVFDGNSAVNSGGALALHRSNCTVGQAEFSRNSAAHGGAVSFGGTSDFTTWPPEGSPGRGLVMHGNQASDTGGAMHVGNESSVRFYANKAGEEPRIEGNTASSSGGGVYVEAGGELNLAGVVLSDNRAVNSAGGGLWFAGSATLQGCSLHNNTADAGGGGGVACDACQSLVMDECTVEANSAAGGGGLLLRPAGRVAVSGSNISANSAQYGGGVWLDTTGCTGENSLCAVLTDLAITYNNNAAGLLNSTQQVLSPEAFLGNDSRVKTGGGLLADLRAAAKFTSVDLSHNWAQLGSAMSVSTLHCDGGCLLLANTTMSGTAAGTAQESQLYLSSLSRIDVLCDDNRGMVLGELAKGGGDGECSAAAQALAAAALVDGALAPFGLVQVDWANADLGLAPKQLIVSPRGLFDVTFLVTDERGQRAAQQTYEPVLFNISLLAGAESRANLTGSTLLQTSDLHLPIRFQALQIQGAPNQTYTLQIRAGAIANATLNVRVDVRDCRAGEHVVLDLRQEQCQICNLQYSYEPVTGCVPCAPHGECYGGVLVPKKGYWHSHPRSPFMHRCPIADACSAGNTTNPWNATRAGQLYAWQERAQGNGTTLHNEALLHSYYDLQCNEREGYTGPLCAICKDGYSLAGTQCKPCQPRPVAITYVFGANIGQIVLVAGQVAIFLLTRRKKKPTNEAGDDATARPDGDKTRRRAGNEGCFDVVMALEESKVALKPSPAQPNEAMLEYASTVARTGSVIRRRSPTITYGTSHLAAEDAAAADGSFSGRSASGSASQAHTQVDGAEDSSTPPAATSGMTAAARSNLIATSVLKLLLQYVQLLGTLQGVALNIPREVLALTQVVDVPSAAYAQPLLCSFLGDSRARMYKWFVASTIIPLLYVVLACLASFVAHWYLHREPVGWRRYLTRVTHGTTVATIFIGMFFYSAISKQLLRIFSFVKLDDDGADVPPGATPAMVGMYWREYPTEQYAHGDHRTLMMVLGIPGLLLVSIGFPIALIAMLLPVHKRLQDPEVQRWYGMLYGEYKPKAVYWQAVVLLTQLLVMLCVVLLSGFGARVQLLSAGMVVLQSFFLHVIVQPFALPELPPLATVTHTCLLASLMLLLYMDGVGETQVWKAVSVPFVCGNVLLVVGLLAVVAKHVVLVAKDMTSSIQLPSLYAWVGTKK